MLFFHSFFLQKKSIPKKQNVFYGRKSKAKAFFEDCKHFFKERKNNAFMVEKVK